MPINDEALVLIKSFEGLRLEPYKDAGGLWTIGYGHAILADEHFSSITESFAEGLLEDDLGDAERDVDHLIDPSMLNENSYGALVSLTYNVGRSPLCMTLGHLVNQGDLIGASLQFARWNKVKIGGKLVVSTGLTRRREAERQLFVKPAIVSNNGVTHA